MGEIRYVEITSKMGDTLTMAPIVNVICLTWLCCGAEKINKTVIDDSTNEISQSQRGSGRDKKQLKKNDD